MSGLVMMAKIANVQLNEKPDGWDTLVFECEHFDSRVNKNIPSVQTALVPKDVKQFIPNFREHINSTVAVPVAVRSSKNGGNPFLVVTGDVQII